MSSGEVTLKVLELLEEFKEKIESCPTVPLTGKGLIDRQDFLDIIQDIKTLLPDEYDHVRHVHAQKNQIVEEAHRDARDILETARAEERSILEAARHQEAQILRAADARANDLINEHEIVELAKTKAKAIVSEAQEKAEGMRVGSYEYAEEVLKKVDMNLSKVLSTVRENLEELDGYK